MNLEKYEKKIKQQNLLIQITLGTIAFILLALINIWVPVILCLIAAAGVGLSMAVSFLMHYFDARSEFKNILKDLAEPGSPGYTSYTKREAERKLEKLRNRHPKIMEFLEKQASE